MYFSQLIFKPYGYQDTQQAILQLPDGYSISVILGTAFYSNGIDTYEVGVVTHNTRVKVYPHCTREDINSIIANLIR